MKGRGASLLLCFACSDVLVDALSGVCICNPILSVPFSEAWRRHNSQFWRCRFRNLMSFPMELRDDSLNLWRNRSKYPRFPSAPARVAPTIVRLPADLGATSDISNPENSKASCMSWTDSEGRCLTVTTEVTRDGDTATGRGCRENKVSSI
jgi:hypothetical protein